MASRAPAPLGPLLILSCLSHTGGCVLDGSFALDAGAQDDAVVEPPALVPSPVVCDPVARALEVVVVVAHFGAEPTACTVDDLRDTWLSAESSVAAFYGEASGQRLSVDGRVVGPLSISPIDDCISLDAAENHRIQQLLYERVDAATEAEGLGISPDATRVYVVPDSIRCDERTPRGAGIKIWNRIFLYGDVCESARISAHELGHILGLNHASAIDATTERLLDVGDPSDVMGNSLFPFNGPHRAQLGWVPAENAVTIAESGQYVLAPLSAAYDAYQLLVIDRHVDDTKAYHLSFRRGAGLDDELPAEILNRTCVHEFWSRCAVQDPRPASKTILLGTVGDGEELSLADGAITIRQLSHGDSGALIEVQLPAEPR